MESKEACRPDPAALAEFTVLCQHFVQWLEAHGGPSRVADVVEWSTPLPAPKAGNKRVSKPRRNLPHAA
jgi:hypothetical protein